jgi:ADP-ribose pyrophosphatase
MKKISERTLFESKWLKIIESIYENKNGIQVTWESVHRHQSLTGVIVIAQLMPSKRLILIKQFRMALEGYILGFPAGLSDGDPNHALTELQEETGYYGKIVGTSPLLKTGSGLINDSGRIIYVEVDETHPRNQTPHQELEPAEDIEVCLIKPTEVKEFLLQEQQQGIHISSSLWYLFGVTEWLAS